MKTSDISIFFDEDLAWDIREEFKELIADGKSSEEATGILLDSYNELLKDLYVPDMFWVILANTQWKYGRLIESVKEKAIEAIDSGRDLERWGHDEKLLRRRKKVLADLKVKLLSPQPAPKKIKKRFVDSTTFEMGDVISYKTESGKFVLMRVIGVVNIQKNSNAVVELLDWYGDKIPSEKEISQLKIKIKIFPGTDHTMSKFWLFSRSKRDYPSEKIRLVMKHSTPFQKEMFRCRGTAWTELDKVLEKEMNFV